MTARCANLQSIPSVVNGVWQMNWPYHALRENFEETEFNSRTFSFHPSVVPHLTSLFGISRLSHQPTRFSHQPHFQAPKASKAPKATKAPKSSAPSSIPSESPSSEPTISDMPSGSPSVSQEPSVSFMPSGEPSSSPSQSPSISNFPSSLPSSTPSKAPKATK